MAASDTVGHLRVLPALLVVFDATLTRVECRVSCLAALAGILSVDISAVLMVVWCMLVMDAVVYKLEGRDRVFSGVACTDTHTF